MSDFLPDEMVLERVTLKRLTLDNAEQFFCILHSQISFFDPFLDVLMRFPTLEKTQNWFEGNEEKYLKSEAVAYGIYTKNNIFIGVVDSLYMKPEHQKADIGYWLSEAHTGFGYVREAVTALEKQLYSIGYRRFRILCDEQNERSANVAKKLGYKLECLMKRERIMGGIPRNTLQFAKVFE
jgi:RimJ/RimL family protein N-acetyltransferase